MTIENFGRSRSRKGSEMLSLFPRGVQPLLEVGRVVAFGEFLFSLNERGI
jgi:hypothetical protein